MRRWGYSLILKLDAPALGREFLLRGPGNQYQQGVVCTASALC
jgi:hypothetical protein